MSHAPRPTPSPLPVLLAAALGAACAGPPGGAHGSATAAWSLDPPIERVEVPRTPDLDPERVTRPGLPDSIAALELERPDGTRAVAYVSARDGLLAQRKPLLVWFEGSGAQSVFLRFPEGLSGGLFGYLAQRHGDRFHVAVCEKRGVDFGEGAERLGGSEGASREYHEHATWDARVADGCLLLDSLLAHPMVDDSLVLVMGHSEGGDVAAGVAAVRDEVTHACVLAGAGVCQWAELMMLERELGLRAGLSDEEVERRVAALEVDYRAIMAAPDSVDDFFQGHAYRRWASFGRRPPVESLLDASADLFLVQGTRDEAVPIQSFDAAVVELLRHGKERVRVLRVPGADHAFRAADGSGEDRVLELLDRGAEWALAGRRASTGVGPASP